MTLSSSFLLPPRPVPPTGRASACYDRAGRPADAGARRHRRERRPAAHRRRPRASGPASLSWVLNGYTLAFGGLLLLGGRLGDVLRSPPGLRGRARAVRARLPARRPRPDPGAAGRRPCGPGRRRRAGRPERARPAHHLRPRRRRAATARSRCSVRSPREAPPSACCSAALLTDVGSWRWTLFINVPIGLAVLAAGAAVRHRDRAPSRPVRRGRRGHRDRRRRLDRLGPDRHARARLDLRRARSSASPSAWPPSPCSRHRAPGRAPDDPAGAARRTAPASPRSP